jgi:SAM-dependent methyltransferase
MSIELDEQHVSVIRKAARLTRKIASRVRRKIFPRKDYVLYDGSLLPAPELRFNGALYRDDAFFLASANKEATRVITKCAFTRQDFLVEIGCGQGRLAIGLLRHFNDARYLGLDVSESSIDWCKRHIEKRHPSFQFRYVNVVNERYNPEGEPLSGDFHFPVPAGTADVVYLWGVVTNMEPKHLIPYAAEISRMLRPGGRVFLTANVEDNVPQSSINPDNYTSFAYQGPLHIVRYETGFFMDVFRRAGLKLVANDYHAAGDCQSEVYFVKQ